MAFFKMDLITLYPLKIQQQINSFLGFGLMLRIFDQLAREYLQLI